MPEGEKDFYDLTIDELSAEEAENLSMCDYEVKGSVKAEVASTPK